MKSIAVAVSISLGLAACGGGQTRVGKVFDTNWLDDGGQSISTIRQRLSAYQIPKGANVAVGVVGDGLLGLPLDAGSAWKFAHAIDARPFVAGQVVVGTGGGSVFALEAASGRKLWERQAGGMIRGAGDDGHTTVVSLAPSSGRGGILLAIDREGQVRRQLEVDVLAGQPAVLANLAFIPWQNQYVTVYDLESGDEVARVTLRHQTSHVLPIGGSLYFGEVGMTRFDDRIGQASRNHASFVDPPTRELPGSPRWMRPGGQVLAPTSDATDRIRLYARPTDRGGSLSLDADRYYATYYHAVLGFRAASGDLAWAQLIPDDAIGGAGYVRGVAVCDEKGDVHFFDGETGTASGKASFKTPIQSCVVQADTLTKPVNREATKPLADQIADAIQTKETEMVMIQRFLLRELVGQSAELATKKLIELASDPRTSPVLMSEVREGLSARRNGVEYMLKALEKRYDYLKDVLTGPPVGPLAFALASMNEKRAAPLLIEHLLDPQTSTDDVKHVALALSKLADRNQVEGLIAFAGMYRCVAVEEDLLQAVTAACRTIVQMDGERGRTLLGAWAADPLTSAPLRGTIASLGRVPVSPSR